MAYGKRRGFKNDDWQKKQEEEKPKKRYFKPNAPLPYVGRKPMTNPSSQQLAIFTDMLSGEGNTIVQARAGTGKTSTMVEALYRLLDEKPNAKVLFLAFNNRIWAEAQSRNDPRIATLTMHKLGYAAVRAAIPGVYLDTRGEKAENIARSILGHEDEKAEQRFMLAKASSLAKNYLCKTVEDVLAFMPDHDIEIGSLKEEEFAAHVITMLDTMLKQSTIIDFDDMVYLPVKLNLNIPKYDYIVVDEAQDTNDARFELAMLACHSSTRVILIGDDRQRIYSFTGVRRNAFERMRSRLNAKTLPLTRTYRCGKAIVNLAKTIVSDYEAAETNGDGLVKTVSEDSMMTNLKAGDFVLSRKNAPLVPICMGMIKERRPCIIQGKDLGKGLKYTIKRSKASTVDGFLSWLDEYKADEVARLSLKKRDITAIVDKCEVLENICEGCHSLNDVYANIDKLFAETDDDNDKIVCSTVHKAKGLEKDTVYVLTETFSVKNADQEEEENILYVAWTRAKDNLFLVQKGALQDRTSEEASKEVDEV